LLGLHSRAVTCQGKLKFHKGLKLISCCFGIPGKSGEAHPHEVEAWPKHS